MKTCSILISNHNSFEAIQLCVESVKKYTQHPHKIIVFDDASINEIDLEYLREAKRKGMIHELIEGKKQITHGGALNILINEICDTDYAAILDCDIQIKNYNWLQDLIDLASRDPKILAICDFKREGIGAFAYRTGFYTFWFGLLNMTAYKDDMQVDWLLRKADRNKEPYKSIFNEWSDKPKPKNFNEDVVHNDPGCHLWLKITYNNPKGYKHVCVPDYIFAKYHHFGHISLISIPNPTHSDQVRINRETRFAQIKSELARLRCAA